MPLYTSAVLDHSGVSERRHSCSLPLSHVSQSCQSRVKTLSRTHEGLEPKDEGDAPKLVPISQSNTATVTSPLIEQMLQQMVQQNKTHASTC